MAGLLLTASVDDEATKVLFQIAARMGKGKELMSAIGQTLLSSTIRRFGTQTAPDGTPWAKLSKATLKKRGPNAKALLASGRLRQSMIFAATASQVEVGTNLIYGRPQFLGATIEMPERTTTIFRSTKDLARGKSRFVKKSKSDFATDHVVAAHQVTIPGRQALGVSASDERNINALVHKFVMGG